MTDAGTPVVTSLIEFNNADAIDRPATLRFDLRPLPPTLKLSFRLTLGITPFETSGVTARSATVDDVEAPPGFGTDIYDLDGGMTADIAVRLPAFGVISAFLGVRAAEPQPAGARYTFDVLQFTYSAEGDQGKGFRLRGGSTFVVPIAGDPPAPPSPVPDDDEGERAQPPTYPWLTAIVGQRFAEAFRNRQRGPTVTRVVVTNDEREYTGPAPVTITFTATLTVDGLPGAVCYAWLRNDGAITPVGNLPIPGPGTYTVTTTWELGQPGTRYEGWQALRIFGDDVMTSAKSEFTAQFTD